MLGILGGIISIIFILFDPETFISEYGGGAPIFVIIGTVILLSTFYKFCRFIEKKVKILVGN